jgi:dienelactone hydrolase
MTFSTYADLNQKMIEHFQSGEFQQALELIEQERGNFQQNRLQVDYWRMCAAARVDNRAHMYKVAETFHKEGLWFGEMMWRLTPSFKLLQGDTEFEKVVAESLRLQSQDSPAGSPVTLKYFPKNISKETPLLIALHGNQNTAAGTLPFWQAAVNEGFVLAVPQSTQAMFKGAYIWDNLDVSFEQVKACYEVLKKELTSERVILAGHSMGGFVAIQMALTGELPVHGLIANGPALPFGDAPEALENALTSAKERGLRAYFIVGDKDIDIEQDAIKVFVDKMKSAGIPCELEIVLGATHDYNPAYEAALIHALKFINS